MAIIALNWQTVHRHGEAWITHHRLRHRIFVQRQSWQVPSYHGLEYDRFDTPAAVYLLWLDDAGQARGVLRLIPTTQPYMVQSLWPGLLDHPCPQSPRVWEASRFGCDRDLPAATRRRVLGELICAALEFALQNGIRRYLAVMPLWMFSQLLARRGCSIRYASRTRPPARGALAAAYIAVAPAILLRVRSLCEIAGPVLQPAGLGVALPDRPRRRPEDEAAICAPASAAPATPPAAPG
jgi:acyl homoserine lactone synthase